jgi:hypothetical protein
MSVGSGGRRKVIKSSVTLRKAPSRWSEFGYRWNQQHEGKKTGGEKRFGMRNASRSQGGRASVSGLQGEAAAGASTQKPARTHSLASLSVTPAICMHLSARALHCPVQIVLPTKVQHSRSQVASMSDLNCRALLASTFLLVNSHLSSPNPQLPDHHPRSRAIDNKTDAVALA